MKPLFISCILTLSISPCFAEGPDCSIYRQGSLYTKEIAIYSMPDVYEMTEVHYRPEYDFGGMSGRPDNRPEENLLVDINIADGQTLPRRIRNSTPPQKQTFFTMLLTGRPYKPISRVIGIYADIWPLDLSSGELIDGKYYYEPVSFTRIDGDFYGFTQIDVTDSPAERKNSTDFFIREDKDGEIISFMTCGKVGSVLVPHCAVYEKTKQFQLDYGFRRNQLYLLETIRRHAHDFTNCLTEPIEGDK